MHEHVFEPGENVFQFENEEVKLSNQSSNKDKNTSNPYIYFIYKGQVDLYVDLQFHNRDRVNKDKSSNNNQQRSWIYTINSSQTIGDVDFLMEHRDLSFVAESRSYSCVHYLKFSDFSKLLKLFPEDREAFCFVKDSVAIYKDLRVIEQFCFSCQSYKHTLLECPMLFYDKRYNQIINNYAQQNFKNKQYIIRSKIRQKQNSLKILQKINARTKYFIDQHKETIYSNTEENRNNNNNNNQNRNKDKEFSITTNSYRADQDFITPSLMSNQQMESSIINSNNNQSRQIVNEEQSQIDNFNSQTTILHQQQQLSSISAQGTISQIQTGGAPQQQNTPKGNQSNPFSNGSLRSLRINTNIDQQQQQQSNSINVQQQIQQNNTQQLQQSLQQSSQVVESSEMSEAPEEDIIFRNKNISKQFDNQAISSHGSRQSFNQQQQQQQQQIDKISERDKSQNNVSQLNNTSQQNVSFNNPPIIQQSEIKEISQLQQQQQQQGVNNANNNIINSKNISNSKDNPLESDHPQPQAQQPAQHRKITKKLTEEEEQLSPSFAIKHQSEQRRKESLLSIVSQKQQNSPTKISNSQHRMSQTILQQQSYQLQQQQTDKQQQQQQNQREELQQLKTKHTLSSQLSDKSEFLISERILNNNNNSSGHQFGLSASSFNRFEELYGQQQQQGGNQIGNPQLQKNGDVNNHVNIDASSNNDLEISGGYGLHDYKIYFPHNNLSNLIHIKKKPCTTILSFK